ncbi:hypothetical protein EJD97_011736 [Solanum chilense]|uniref:Retrotransposon gag domain-containing protein n=1 Tax=Solanum chilense TaxID=4083 RepID=A0A6N2CI13_SOLCI|nr:hypothetical protein EJD97_011736 [Solanum chilense]
MSVEEYSLKFTLFSKYSPSLVSNPRDEMSRFMTNVVVLVKEECRTTIIHSNMKLCRLMVYGQSIEDSKLCRISRNMKRGRSDEKNQPWFKKRDPNQDYPSSPKANHERSVGSQGVNLTCSSYGKNHFWKCLAETNAFVSCGKDDHKRNRFYCLEAKSN